MSFSFFSLVSPPPRGFTLGTPSRSDLLGKKIVILAETLDEILSIVKPHLKRVEGLAITFAPQISYRALAPHFYHFAAKESMREDLRNLAEFHLSMLHSWTVAESQVAELNTELQLAQGKLKHTRSNYDSTLDRLAKAMEDMRQQKDRFAYILEGTHVGTWEWNIQTGVVIFNERWAEMAGYTLEELAPVTIETWLRLTHPNDLHVSQDALEKHFRGETNYYEIEARHRHKDGHWIWVLDRGKVISWTEEGKPLWMYGTHQDISARHSAEETIARMNDQLQAKNKELEQVIYVASHDLRAPLVNIAGFSQELAGTIEFLRSLPSFPLTSETKEAFEDIGNAIQFILKSTRRMDSLLAGLLKLSRLGREAMSIETLDMNKLVNLMLAENEYLLRECCADVQVEDLPPCEGDVVSVNQVFSNLISNAVKYRSSRRPLQIRITGYAESERSVYCIADNGIGIAVAHQSRIFEVFHRLQPQNSPGEGLGLAIVRQNLGRMGGTVWVESTVDQGSQFFIALPH